MLTPVLLLSVLQVLLLLLMCVVVCVLSLRWVGLEGGRREECWWAAARDKREATLLLPQISPGGALLLRGVASPSMALLLVCVFDGCGAQVGGKMKRRGEKEARL
jgi:hypothetical protein